MTHEKRWFYSCNVKEINRQRIKLFQEGETQLVQLHGEAGRIVMKHTELAGRHRRQQEAELGRTGR